MAEVNEKSLKLYISTKRVSNEWRKTADLTNRPGRKLCVVYVRRSPVFAGRAAGGVPHGTASRHLKRPVRTCHGLFVGTGREMRRADPRNDGSCFAWGKIVCGQELGFVR